MQSRSWNPFLNLGATAQSAHHVLCCDLYRGFYCLKTTFSRGYGVGTLSYYFWYGSYAHVGLHVSNHLCMFEV